MERTPPKAQLAQHNVMLFYDCFRYLSMYFDMINAWKIIHVSNKLIVWRCEEDDIQKSSEKWTFHINKHLDVFI